MPATVTRTISGKLEAPSPPQAPTTAIKAATAHGLRSRKTNPVRAMVVSQTGDV
jgi:hypothetical protein